MKEASVDGKRSLPLEPEHSAGGAIFVNSDAISTFAIDELLKRAAAIGMRLESVINVLE